MNFHAAYTQPCFLQGAIKLDISFFIAKNNNNGYKCTYQYYVTAVLSLLKGAVKSLAH